MCRTSNVAKLRATRGWPVFPSGSPVERPSVGQAADRQVKRRGPGELMEKGRQPAVHRPGRAQGRRDESRPGIVGDGSRNSRGVGEPYRDALTKLQKDAPPLPAEKVHRVLTPQLGTKCGPVYFIDDSPVASASIGQVHKAVWSDGRDVAVKIQYPGADEALRADLKTMQRDGSGFSNSSHPAPTSRGVGGRTDRAHRDGPTIGWEADNQRKLRQGVCGSPASSRCRAS